VSNDETLVAELIRDEGIIPHAYQDHLGYWTIGIGRLIDKRKGGGIAEHEAAYLLLNDIAKVQNQLDVNLPWWRELDPVRQRALTNMAFQLGISGLLKFRNSLAAIKAGEWERAAANLKLSLWARQTPTRAGRVIEMFRAGAA
jgi:lysozyme